MQMPYHRAVTWRRLQVDGEDARWTVSVSLPSSAIAELHGIKVTLVIRTESARIIATFHGFAVDDLWDGRKQTVTVTPRVVADVVRAAKVHGATINHAERLFPGAITAADPRDLALAAACAQWFVPYPGRAALMQAMADLHGDVEAVAKRFSTEAHRLTGEQIDRWITVLNR
jgi:hypothetical protein